MCFSPFFSQKFECEIKFNNVNCKYFILNVDPDALNMGRSKGRKGTGMQIMRLGSVCKPFTPSTSSLEPHSWVKGIHVSLNKEPCLFPKGANTEIARVH